MPSVLIETGFLTNKREGAYLNSKKGQNEISVAIAKAILNYKNELEKGVISKDLFYGNKVTEISKINKNIRFSVQLAASKKAIETKSYNFKGLKNIIREKEGGGDFFSKNFRFLIDTKYASVSHMNSI